MSITFFITYAKYFELLAALIGFLYWNKLKKFGAESFPIYLTFLFLFELIAPNLKNPILISNLYAYLIIPIQAIYFIWFIGTKGLKNSKLVYTLLFLYLLVYCTEYYLVKEYTYIAFTKNFGFAGILLALLVILYLNQLAKSNSIINFYNDFFFWICVGVTVYYIFCFPFYTSYNTLLSKFRTVFDDYRKLSLYLSLSMYLIFITGILWSKMK